MGRLPEYACILCLSIIGLPLNVLAITAKIKKMKGLSNTLYLLLILSDIYYLLCTFFLGLSFLASLSFDSTSQILIYAMIFGNFESSCITTIISIVRAVVVSRPFCNVRRIYVLIPLMTITLIILAEVIILSIRYDSISFPVSLLLVQVGVQIVISVVTSLVIIVVMQKSRGDIATNETSYRRRRVTVTVLTITLIFIVTNGLGIFFAIKQKKSPRAILLTLNSVLNPVVLIYRQVFNFCYPRLCCVYSDRSSVRKLESRL